jgi:hypothetical protein
MPKNAEVIILDNNPLSIACYMEEHPEVSFEEDTMVKSNHIEEKKKENIQGCGKEIYIGIGLPNEICGLGMLCPFCEKKKAEENKKEKME